MQKKVDFSIFIFFLFGFISPKITSSGEEIERKNPDKKIDWAQTGGRYYKENVAVPFLKSKLTASTS